MHELHNIKHIMILQYKLTQQTMAWQATVIIIIYAVFFDETADLSTTKNVFNYFWIGRVVCTKYDYFTPFRVCIQVGAVW